MKKSIIAFVVGLISWVLVVSLLNRGLRISLPGYAAAEQSFAFTLGMLIARLTMAALTSLIAGATVTAVAPQSNRTPWVLGAVITALFVPQHVWIWDKFPAWYHLTFLLTLAALVAAGARIARSLRGRAPVVA